MIGPPPGSQSNVGDSSEADAAAINSPLPGTNMGSHIEVALQRGRLRLEQHPVSAIKTGRARHLSQYAAPMLKSSEFGLGIHHTSLGFGVMHLQASARTVCMNSDTIG